MRLERLSSFYHVCCYNKPKHMCSVPMTFFFMATLRYVLVVGVPLAAVCWVGQKIGRHVWSAVAKTFQKHVVVFIDPVEDINGPQWASVRVLGTSEPWDPISDTLFGLHIFGKLVNNIRQHGMMSRWCKTHVHVVVPANVHDSLFEKAILANNIDQAIGGRQIATTSVYYCGLNKGQVFVYSPSWMKYTVTDMASSVTEDTLQNIQFLRDRIPSTIDLLILYSGSHITDEMLAAFVSTRRVKITLAYTDIDTGRNGFVSEEERAVAADQDALRYMHPAGKNATLQQMSLHTYAFSPGPSNQLNFLFDALDTPESAIQIAEQGFENCRQWIPALLFRECYDNFMAESFDFEQNNHTVLEQFQQHADKVVSKSAAFFVYAATLCTWQKNSFRNIGAMFSSDSAGADEDDLMLVEESPLHWPVNGCFRAQQPSTSSPQRSAWSIKLLSMGESVLRERVLSLVHSATQAQEARRDFDGWDADSD
jgi:hypothetical protein